jgi:phage-related protein
MEVELKKLPVAFYRSTSGAEPVREWLRELSDADRRILGYDIGVVEFGWPIGMPVCRPLGGGLWEVRSALTGKRIVRVIFCVAHDRMVLLHGFIKKTRKTPQSELDLARKRRKEVGQ